MRVLVSGGAGFVGSHLVDRLINKGYRVRIVDNLDGQVHKGREPDYLNKEAEFRRIDVCDYARLKDALEDIDVVFHLASRVGVGQSMYEIADYIRVNDLGTANLLELIIKHRRIKKLIIASSMSIYGEGAYLCPNCADVALSFREIELLKRRKWNPLCPHCRGRLSPRPTRETDVLSPTSIYALSKMDQEKMCLMIGKAYNIPVVGLRYFNIYGPRQALSNPYTGVCAIFSARLKNGQAPLIYEDGLQMRDFISVYDITRANILAMEREEANFEVFNVGTGKPTTILKIAHILAKLYGRDTEVHLTGRYRQGDIRHCYADVSKIKRLLGFQPEIEIERGMQDLVRWAEEKEAEDKVLYADSLLDQQGLVI